MNALGKLIWLMVWTALNDAASAEANCGRLEERLLFRKTLIMEPTEYPWIGLLVQRKGQRFENAKCTVAIVGESHVLTTASCVRRFHNRPELIAVRLGIWEETHEPGQQYICSDRGFCVPGPVQHLVDAITLYPLADKDTANNDIAILRLSQRINMTAYIQPLCLQPTLEPASWTSMDFHYGGFQDFDLQKGKGTAVTISWQYCTNETSILPSENQFCAFPKFRVAFYNGAPLIGINVEDDVPRSFYLVGLLVRAVELRQVLVFFFQDIRPLRRWIMDNIESANSQ